MKNFNNLFSGLRFVKINPFICAMFLLIAMPYNNIMAQIPGMAKVRLKNGTVIKGNVFDSYDGSYVKIRLDPTQPVTYVRYEDIRKIIFRDKSGFHTLKVKDEKPEIQKIGLKDHSFYHELKGGILFGEDNTSITLHNINGYQFKRYLAPGLGIGFDRYGSYRTVPLYAHIKGYLLDRKVAPYYFADIGYGFAWYNSTNDEAYDVTNVHGGLYWQAGIGYRFSYPHAAMLFTLGYKNQTAGLNYVFDQRRWVEIADDASVEVSEKRILRRVAFTIGFLF